MFAPEEGKNCVVPAVAILRALLSKSGLAGFDPSALLAKNELNKVKRFLWLRFHPDKNVGNIQAAHADAAANTLGVAATAGKSLRLGN